MEFSLVTWTSAITLFVAMLILVDVGRRAGVAQRVRNPDAKAAGFGAAEGAVLGLLGLVIAFTFDGAGDRLEHRRHMIIEEANAIGTAYLRLDLLPADAATDLRERFRRYVDLRLATHSHMQDVEGTARRFAETDLLQREIWSRALPASGRPEANPHAPMLLLPALNAMFDMEASRSAAVIDHPPFGVFMLLALLGLVAAVLVGYAMAENGRRSWIHMLAFAGIVSISLFFILELEYPRAGIIRVDAADRALIEARRGMQ